MRPASASTAPTTGTWPGGTQCWGCHRASHLCAPPLPAGPGAAGTKGGSCSRVCAQLCSSAQQQAQNPQLPWEARFPYPLPRNGAGIGVKTLLSRGQEQLWLEQREGAGSASSWQPQRRAGSVSAAPRQARAMAERDSL